MSWEQLFSKLRAYRGCNELWACRSAIFGVQAFSQFNLGDVCYCCWLRRRCSIMHTHSVSVTVRGAVWPHCGLCGGMNMPPSLVSHVSSPSSAQPCPAISTPATTPHNLTHYKTGLSTYTHLASSLYVIPRLDSHSPVLPVHFALPWTHVCEVWTFSFCLFALSQEVLLFDIFVPLYGIVFWTSSRLASVFYFLVAITLLPVLLSYSLL